MSDILAITGLKVEFPLAEGGVFTAVEDVSLTVGPGEIHALVGESGAGKSTVGNALMGLLEAPGRIAAGRIEIAGHILDISSGKAQGIVPGRDVGAIFQDPMTSLNPLFTVESQLGETMRHHLGLSRAEARARSLDLLRAVGIPEPERRLAAYPHQLSGGQRQRVVIAAALCCEPRLLVADEPTTALDVSVQAQILRLIRGLADDRGIGVLLITHNMGVVAEIADRVTVMLRGRVVETGDVRAVLEAPRHDYARNLIGAVPRVDRRLPRMPVPGEETPRARDARAIVRAWVPPAGDASELLRVEGLTVDYSAGLWRRRHGFRAVDNVSFSVKPGEIFGLIGESGSGKTTVANAVAGLVRPTAGTVTIGTTKRRALQMVFQDPYSALNPRLRISTALAEPILHYRLAATRAEAREDAALLLEAVGLDRASGAKFPFAFSGGQRQRIAIARALAARPALLVCDEPTSSLDVSVQAQILNLLKDLRDATGLAMLFISHDLAVIRQMCDRVAVMRAGRIVELAEAEALFNDPQHQSTRELLALVPTLASLSKRHGAV